MTRERAKPRFRAKIRDFRAPPCREPINSNLFFFRKIINPVVKPILYLLVESKTNCNWLSNHGGREQWVRRELSKHGCIGEKWRIHALPERATGKIPTGVKMSTSHQLSNHGGKERRQLSNHGFIGEKSRNDRKV